MTTSQTKPAAPLTEIGYAQAPNYNWWQYQDETTPELQWPQSISVYDAMRRTDAQVTSVLRAMTLPVRSTPWRIDPNGASDEVTEFVADNLGLPIVGQEPKSPLRQQDRFSWDEHLRQALLMLPFGHMYFEQTYRIDPDGKARLRKLGPRMPKTISQIDVAEDGGLISITQYWTAVDRKPQPIPVNRLVAYIHEKEGGNWLGSSILRPGYKNWLLKDRLLRVWAQTIERNGMGVPRYTGAEGEASLAQGLAMARAWRSGESAGTAIPFGSMLDLVGVNGTLPDAEPAVRYHDEQLGRAVLAHFLNLGTQTGSWALGTTFADFFTLSLQSLAQQVEQVGSLYIIEDLVDVNWGPDEPAPKLVCDEIGSRQPATAQSLVALFGAGALTPDARLEESLRQQYGLPPKEQAPDATGTAAPLLPPDQAQTQPEPVLAGGVGPKGEWVEAGHPHPGQKYRHGWIPVGGSPSALLNALSDLKEGDEKYLDELQPEVGAIVRQVFNGTHGGITAEVGDESLASPSPAEEVQLRAWLAAFDSSDRTKWPTPKEIADSGKLGESILDGSSWSGERVLGSSNRPVSASIDDDEDDEPGQFESTEDIDTAALVAALAAFCGEVYAAAEFSDKLHPRGAGGRFRNTFARIVRALEDWGNGDSPSNANPFEGHGFTRAQLRDAAKKRGVTLRHGASEPEIVEALKADVRAKRGDAKAAKSPDAGKPVRFTLTGGGEPRKAGQVKGRNIADDHALISAAFEAGKEGGEWQGGGRFEPDKGGYQAHLTLAKQQGFDGLPQVFRRDQNLGANGEPIGWNKLENAGWRPLYRGWGWGQGEKPGKTGQDMAHQFLYGPLHVGGGVGLGTNMSDDLDNADYYARQDRFTRIHGSATVAFLLSPDAKVIKYPDAVKQRDDYLAKLPPGPRYEAERKVFDDPGTFAMARGYDAMVATHDDHKVVKRGTEEWVIFNRTKVAAWEDNPEAAKAWKAAHKPTVDSKLRNLDVGVFHENGKLALWEVSDSGERRKRVALVDDLAGLESWANEHGESELAGWARKERGGAEVPKAPTKRVIGRDLTANLDYASISQIPYVSGEGDPELSHIWAQQGFDGPPRVVNNAEWDRLTKAGGTPIYRGVRGLKDGLSADQIAERYATGDHYPGIGVFGNGAYFVDSPKTANDYSVGKAYGPLNFNRGNRALEGSAVIEAMLLPDARVLDFQDVEHIRQSMGLPAEFSFHGADGEPRQLVLGDPGRLAAALGYDAVRVRSGLEYGDELLVLNRTATAVRRPDGSGSIAAPRRDREHAAGVDVGAPPRGDRGPAGGDVGTTASGRKSSPGRDRGAVVAPKKTAPTAAPVEVENAIRPPRNSRWAGEHTSAIARLTSEKDIRDYLGAQKLSTDQLADVADKFVPRDRTLPKTRTALINGIVAGRMAEVERQSVPLGTASPPNAAPDVNALRTLDTESRRDALDLRKVDELKAMLREQGLPVSGKKRDLVDRLVGHLDGGAGKPAAPNVRPSGLPTDRKLVSGDFDDLAGRLIGKNEQQILDLLADLNASELARLARKYEGARKARSTLSTARGAKSGLRFPDDVKGADERRRWLAQQLTSRRNEWR